MTHQRLRSIAVVLGLLVATMLAGCASSPEIYSRADPKADFSQFKTYGFLAKPATDKAGYESTETRVLKATVSRELDRRGLSYSDNPDLLFNFYILTREKVRSTSVPRPGGYYGYYRYRDPFYEPWGGYGYETRIEQYTEGTLTIDCVEAKQKKLVWEGSIVGRVTKTMVENLEKELDEAAKLVLDEFPVKPPVEKK